MTTFPKTLDTDNNLFLVHDSLRVRLTEDYNPGDTSIYVEGDPDVMAKFPATGIVTLTEQQSDIDQRAISFTYASKSDFEFNGLEIIPGFVDCLKPKTITNVTQNVMAIHHNTIKDALIAIEEFVGVDGTVDTKPLGDTIVGRINFLRNLVLTPRAWIAADKHIGLVPLTIEFKDQSFRLGDGDVTFTWDFGNGQTQTNVYTQDMLPTLPIEITYDEPGNYDVSLTVINKYGQDTVEFPSFINARIAAPLEAEINFNPRTNQISTAGDEEPYFNRLATAPGGPFTIPPTIRASINSFIDIEVPSGRRSPSEDRSYAGELLDQNDTPFDPVESYTWSLGDDLTHPSIPTARASYSIGGIYDLKLRVDTQYSGYRITTYQNSIDIIERKNLWLFTLASTNVVNQNTALGHEYGLISETFKTATRTLTVARNDSFLTGTGEEERAKREFKKNTAFAMTSSTPSGDRGKALLMWASGGSTMSPSGLAAQTINSQQYEGFADIYTAGVTIQRPWNWVFLNSGSKGYFVFGPDPALIPNHNYVSQRKTTLTLNSLIVTEQDPLNSASYRNGANELQVHVTSPADTVGEPATGRFAVYRSAWKGQTGYILRNDGVGEFFRIRSFYKTEGTLTEPFIYLKKLPDLVGSTKIEGQLVTLSSGVFFFNNSGNISAYNDTSGVWEVGSSVSVSFRSVQDSNANGFDSQANTLLATSDLDKSAYLSYDYSSNAFIKFNAADMTFTNLGSRPQGQQWIMDIY